MGPLLCCAWMCQLIGALLTQSVPVRLGFPHPCVCPESGAGLSWGRACLLQSSGVAVGAMWLGRRQVWVQGASKGLLLARKDPAVPFHIHPQPLWSPGANKGPWHPAHWVSLCAHKSFHCLLFPCFSPGLKSVSSNSNC